MPNKAPASDAMVKFWGTMAKAEKPVSSAAARRIFLRLHAEKARADKAETDNANLTKLLSGYHQICSEAGIAPATSEIYAAAERAGGGNG